MFTLHTHTPENANDFMLAKALKFCSAKGVVSL